MKQTLSHEQEEAILEHYGIKGMRWGVRRKNPSGGTPPKSQGQKADFKSLTNKDLQSRIQRLQLEKQYSKLLDETNKRDRSAIDKGRDEVKKMLVNAGKNALQNYVQESFSVVVKKGAPVVGAAITSTIADKRN